MKKEYTAPTAQVEEFDLKDVIMATSTSEVPEKKASVLTVQATVLD